MSKLIHAIALTLVSLGSSGACAQGALNFADPCIKAEGQFADTSEALRSRADAVIAEWDRRTSPPEEVRPLYVEAIKLAYYNAWQNSAQVGPIIQLAMQGNPQFDAKAFFLEKVYPAVVTAEDEARLVDVTYKTDYATSIRPKFLTSRNDLEKQIGEQKAVLDKSCKKDVFNQFFRATFGNAITVVTSNFEAAKNESGDAAKAFRAISGISLTDIQQYGIRGGPNSEFNKALDGLGDNSDVKKALTALVDSLNPASWLPGKLPDITLPPIPTVNVPGTDLALPVPSVPTVDVGGVPVPVPVIIIPVVIPPIKLPDLPSCCKF
jgi:hypothetical protein